MTTCTWWSSSFVLVLFCSGCLGFAHPYPKLFLFFHRKILAPKKKQQKKPPFLRNNSVNYKNPEYRYRCLSSAECVVVIPAADFTALVLLWAWVESARRGTLYSPWDLGYQKADMFPGLKVVQTHLRYEHGGQLPAVSEAGTSIFPDTVLIREE